MQPLRVTMSSTDSDGTSVDGGLQIHDDLSQKVAAVIAALSNLQVVNLSGWRARCTRVCVRARMVSFCVCTCGRYLLVCGCVCQVLVALQRFCCLRLSLIVVTRLLVTFRQRVWSGMWAGLVLRLRGLIVAIACSVLGSLPLTRIAQAPALAMKQGSRSFHL
jgi:hypothetical protein